MAQGPADVIVVGATIHGSAANDAPEAFAVCGERFAHVGSGRGAMALRGPSTEVLDLRGRTVLPGLIDAHLHLTNMGLTLKHVRLEASTSFEEVVARTASFAARCPDEWIVGRGWDQTRWPVDDFPTHAALSAAVPDRPVVLARVDGHALLANERAMAAAGIADATRDPQGGRIVRQADGRPTGIFIDAAQTLIYDVVPKPTHEQLVEAARAGIAECNRWGVTAVAEPGCDEAVLRAHAELLEAGEYSIRNYAMLHDDPALIEARLRGGTVEGAYGGRLWVRAIKMYADGALGSRGAALLEPYSDDAANAGLVLTPPDHIEAVTEWALRSGFQACTHAIGDRANRIVLNAYQAALARAGSDAARLRVEHAQVIHADDLPRFAQLGVIASMQASHALSDGAWTPLRLGAKRTQGAFAWRALLDSGARIANGTDAPVEPVNSMRTFYASVTSGGPARAMTRREALASMTSWAAYANFQENVIGSIDEGKYADFVVIDRDWMRVPYEEIKSTRFLATYFAGRCVYATSTFP